jgi:hypothetical protein
VLDQRHFAGYTQDAAISWDFAGLWRTGSAPNAVHSHRIYGLRAAGPDGLSMVLIRKGYGLIQAYWKGYGLSTYPCALPPLGAALAAPARPLAAGPANWQCR